MHAVTRTSRIWILERYTSKLDRNEEGEREGTGGTLPMARTTQWFPELRVRVVRDDHYVWKQNRIRSSSLR
jgi:hypothetical protein